MTKLKLLTNLVDKDKNITLTADTLHDFTIKDGFYKINYPDNVNYTLISNEYQGKLFDLVKVDEVVVEESIVVNDAIIDDIYSFEDKPKNKSGGKKKNETV